MLTGADLLANVRRWAMPPSPIWCAAAAIACAVINVGLMLAAWRKQWVTALRCTVAPTHGRVLLGQLQHFSEPMRQWHWPLLLEVSQVCKWNWKLSIGSSNYLISLKRLARGVCGTKLMRYMACLRTSSMHTSSIGADQGAIVTAANGDTEYLMP